MKTTKDIVKENFFKNVGATRTSLEKISEMFNDSFKLVYDWDCGSSSDLTDYIPSPMFTFIPEKMCLKIYSGIYPKIAYNIDISEFIEEVMKRETNDKSFITLDIRVLMNKDILWVKLIFKEMSKIFSSRLQNSPFADIREMTDWIKEFLEEQGTCGRSRTKCKKSLEEVKQTFRKIAGEL